MSRNVKKVVSTAVMLAVGMTVGATGVQLFNSHSAKKGLKRDIEVAQEYANMLRVLSDIYHKQADCYAREDLSKITRENSDLAKNCANDVEELTRIAEDISGKIFVSERDKKKIVELEQTIDTTDFQYWKNLIESEKKELEKMKTGIAE